MKNERVILAHGWLSGPYQVAALGRALTAAGYEVTYVAHNSVFGRFETAVARALKIARTEDTRPVHLVGFSLGGLVMRSAAAEDVPNLASLLLIGAPNAGSPFADFLCYIFPTPAVRRLLTSAPKLPEPPAGLRVGCIAGNRHGILGLFLPAPNDSRVSVGSALAVRHDFARVVHAKHRTLHRSVETHRYAVAFLRSCGQTEIGLSR